MRTPRVFLTMLVVSAGLLAGASGSAFAQQKRVAVLAIEGARSSTLEQSLGDVVSDLGAVVVSDRVYRKAATRLKARMVNADNVAEVANYLEVDAVLEGTLHPKRDGYRLSLRLREGVSGRALKTYVIPIRGDVLSERHAEKLGRRLREQFASLPTADDGARRRADRDVPPPAVSNVSSRPRRQLDLTPPPTSQSQGGRFAEEDYEEQDFAGASREEREAQRREVVSAFANSRFRDDRAAELRTDRDVGDDDLPSRDPLSRVSLVSLAAGPTFVGRSLTFRARPDLAAPPSQYTDVFAPGVAVRADIFPMAYDSQENTFINNIGFGFRLERALAFQSPVRDPAGGQIGLPSARQSFGVDFRYRVNLGKSNRAPSAIFSAGFNQRSYVIDKTPLQGTQLVVDVPNVSYSYLDPRLTLRFGLAEGWALNLSGAFLAVLGAGDIATPQGYGAATISGFDADINLRWRTKSRLEFAAGFEAVVFGYAFAGNGELSANRDMNPATVDVGGALDRYLGGYVTAGFVY